MRISEINLYYSEMQLERSEIDLKLLKLWKLLKLTWIISNSLGNFWNWPGKGVDLPLMSEGNTLDVVALFAEALKALDVLDYISVYMVKTICLCLLF